MVAVSRLCDKYPQRSNCYWDLLELEGKWFTIGKTVMLQQTAGETFQYCCLFDTSPLSAVLLFIPTTDVFNNHKHENDLKPFKQLLRNRTTIRLIYHSHVQQVPNESGTQVRVFKQSKLYTLTFWVFVMKNKYLFLPEVSKCLQMSQQSTTWHIAEKFWTMHKQKYFCRILKGKLKHVQKQFCIMSISNLFTYHWRKCWHTSLFPFLIKKSYF